ncbi:hypothetical protein J3459_022412 [Metarhizium acridum]|nr:hypothetical protein J3459_022412 [Metarhizium acridum]
MKITVSMTHCRVLGHMNRIPPLREAMHPGSGLNLTTEEPKTLLNFLARQMIILSLLHHRMNKTQLRQQ